MSFNIKMELITTTRRLTKRQLKTQELLLKWLLNHLSPLTRKTYEQTLREFGSFLDKRKIQISQPKDIKPLIIIAYRDWLISKDQAPKTICRKLSCISSVMDEVVFAQEAKSNPCSAVKRVKPESTKAKTYFSDREIKQLIALYPDEEKLYQLQNKTLISIFSFTGQRVSSVVNLLKKNVSMMGATPVLELKIKGGSKKLLPLPEEPARLLIKLLRYRLNDDDYIFQATREKRGKRKPLSRIAVHSLIKTSLKRIKADTSRSSHTFRQSLISACLNVHKIPLETVKETIAFHKNPQTTLEYKKDYEFRLEAHPLITTFNEPKTKSEEWETPREFFEKVHSVFGFTLDVSASEENHKTEKFYDTQIDGLKQSWQTEGSVWCNSPFSRLAEFVGKAIEESLVGQTIVVLMPARTDTKYYHQAMNSPNLTHRLDVAGRLQFNEDKSEFNANFATMLLIFNGGKAGEKIEKLKELGFLSQVSR